ncbi:MAG: hypothetical protein R3E42_08630 [Burkholderiaceae bacterium]
MASPPSRFDDLHRDTPWPYVRRWACRHGENSEALFLTSGYVQPSAEAARAASRAREEGFTYGRYGNPTVSSFRAAAGCP